MLPEQFIVEFDRAVRTVFAPARSQRRFPGENHPEVNHVGEICAQALYQGQALTSRDPSVRESLRSAADEETEHLAWTEQRLAELGGRKSLLNPLWYTCALSMGLIAGRLGDEWNLGFLAETERQVEAHLDSHLESLPKQDLRSREVVDQMRIDEIRHAEAAVSLGAAELPAPIKAAMKLAAKVMTATAYRV